MAPTVYSLNTYLLSLNELEATDGTGVEQVYITALEPTKNAAFDISVLKMTSSSSLETSHWA